MEKKQWNRVSHELAIVIGKWVEGCIPKDQQHVIGEDEGGQLLVNIMDFLEQDGAYPSHDGSESCITAPSQPKE